MAKYLMNRLANCSNRFQGNYKRVLCVCSAGLLRSPTAAWVLSKSPYNYNTRAVGLDKQFALITLDEVLLEWADEFVCMDQDQADEVKRRLGILRPKDVISLDIEDSYKYRDPELIEKIKKAYEEKKAKSEPPVCNGGCNLERPSIGTPQV